MFDLESAIDNWKQSYLQDGLIDTASIVELETHLRDLTADLCKLGLSEHEAFMVGSHRLGRASELQSEFAKVFSLEIWRKRVLWMLGGHIAVSLGGVIVSAIVSLSAAGMSILGLGGSTAGVASIAVQALGWITVFGLFFRKSHGIVFHREVFPLRWSIGTGAALVLLPAFTYLVTTSRLMFTDIKQYSDELVWTSIGTWTIHSIVCGAFLILMNRLSEPLRKTADATA